jgi:hypothetical protein
LPTGSLGKANLLANVSPNRTSVIRTEKKKGWRLAKRLTGTLLYPISSLRILAQDGGTSCGASLRKDCVLRAFSEPLPEAREDEVEAELELGVAVYFP